MLVNNGIMAYDWSAITIKNKRKEEKIMRKILIGTILLFAIMFTFGCSSSQENSTSKSANFTITKYDFTCMSNYSEKDGYPYFDEEEFSTNKDADGLASVILINYTYTNSSDEDEQWLYNLPVYQGDNQLSSIWGKSDYLWQLDDFPYSDFPMAGGMVKAHESQEICYAYVLYDTSTPIEIRNNNISNDEIIKEIPITKNDLDNISSRKKLLIKKLGIDIINQTPKVLSETDSAKEEIPKDDSFDDSSTDDTSYQSVLDEYSEKIKEATPGLVEEYKNEAAEHSGDINKLAEISNDKVGKLAEISNEGIEEMANIMYSNGDDYDTYEEWSKKLMDVYTEYAEKIMDAYIDSAT